MKISFIVPVVFSFYHQQNKTDLDHLPNPRRDLLIQKESFWKGGILNIKR